MSTEDDRVRVPKLLVTAALTVIASTSASAAEWNTAESRARWAELTHEMFGASAAVDKGDGTITLAAPDTAQDAALVPVTLEVAPGTPLKALDLVIDQNPSPIAAKITFGAAGDARETKLRVRVNAFTNMHAVAVLATGKLLQDVKYVQGAGGCSAPMGSEADATADMGEMRMKFAVDEAFPGARAATLMIRHPNFNGMQMDPKTHALMPARYIRSVTVTRGNATVFDLLTDISLATNPVIGFLYRPDIEAGRPIEVKVIDTTGKTWTQRFDVPGQG